MVDTPALAAAPSRTAAHPVPKPNNPAEAPRQRVAAAAGRRDPRLSPSAGAGTGMRAPAGGARTYRVDALAVRRERGVSSGELHGIEVVIIGGCAFAAAAEAPGHHLEGT
jgi:hypothetical protein